MQNQRRRVLETTLTGLANENAAQVVLDRFETTLGGECHHPVGHSRFVARTARNVREDLEDAEDLLRLQTRQNVLRLNSG